MHLHTKSSPTPYRLDAMETAGPAKEEAAVNKYVKNSQSNFKLLGLTLLFVFATTLFSSACEPGGEPIIENQLNQEVGIYVTLVSVNGNPDKTETPTDYGVVPAQTTKELASIVFVRRSWVYRIEAVDPSGNVIFSHDYNMNDLEKIDWKIVIPPS